MFTLLCLSICLVYANVSGFVCDRVDSRMDFSNGATNQSEDDPTDRENSGTKETSETIEMDDLLNTMQAEFNKSEDKNGEKFNKILNYLQSHLSGKARKIQIFFKNVWQAVDLGLHGSERRMKNLRAVRSMMQFIGELLNWVWTSFHNLITWSSPDDDIKNRNIIFINQTINIHSPNQKEEHEHRTKAETRHNSSEHTNTSETNHHESHRNAESANSPKKKVGNPPDGRPKTSKSKHDGTEYHTNDHSVEHEPTNVQYVTSINKNHLSEPEAKHLEEHSKINDPTLHDPKNIKQIENHPHSVSHPYPEAEHSRRPTQINGPNTQPNPKNGRSGVTYFHPQQNNVKNHTSEPIKDPWVWIPKETNPHFFLPKTTEKTNSESNPQNGHPLGTVPQETTNAGLSGGPQNETSKKSNKFNIGSMIKNLFKSKDKPASPTH